MTATERVRELLDERGVEYGFVHGYKIFHWDYDGANGKGSVSATEVDGGINIIAYGLTPEQAIAATLGAGTCQDLGGTGANDEQVFNCSECGCVLSLYDRDGTNTLCTHFVYDYPRYCPECGRKVVEE